MVQPRALPGEKAGETSGMRPPVACGSECEVSRRSDTLAVRNGVREDASAADSGRFRDGIVGFQAPGFLRKSADFRGFSRIHTAAARRPGGSRRRRRGGPRRPAAWRRSPWPRPRSWSGSGSSSRSTLASITSCPSPTLQGSIPVSCPLLIRRCAGRVTFISGGATSPCGRWISMASGCPGCWSPWTTRGHPATWGWNSGRREKTVHWTRASPRRDRTPTSWSVE